MTVYYAPGGGLGHVARAHRVLAALAIDDARIIATAGDGVLAIPPELEGDVEGHRRWLDSIVDAHLIVDSFPAGIQGELEGLEVPRIDHVARLLRWDEYRHVVPQSPPRFVTTWVVEELTPEHAAFVRGNSDVVEPLDLHVTTGPAAATDDGWLIVHSGPAEEVRELIDYAAELRALERSSAEVRVVTRAIVDLPRGFRRAETADYAAAARIITAAGFNVMLETASFRDRHHALPFPRRFDDQFLRAARCRKSESGPLLAR